MSESGQEKTQEPTDRRRDEFAERGEFARSKELGAVATLAVVAVGARYLADPMGNAARNVIQSAFLLPNDLGLESVGAVKHLLITGIVEVGGPLIAIVWLATLVAAVVQTRGIVPKEGLALKWERLDPFANAKQQFFSAQPWVELAKGLVVLLAIGALAWHDRDEVLPMLAAGIYATPAGIMSAIGTVILKPFLWALPVAVTVAGLELGYQTLKIGEDMKMTLTEVKDEAKDTEGDPHVRAARRAFQRLLLAQVNVNAVKTADVVVTNPTHFAVALRYRKNEGRAPIVVARGADHLALKIKAEARRHGVAVVENRPLARALYAKAKLKHVIPEDLYAPVAELLALVMRRRRAR